MMRKAAGGRVAHALASLALTIAVASAMVGTGAAAVTPGGTATPAAPMVQGVLQRLNARNGDLRSFQSHVHAEFRLRSFPYIREHLDGTAYYKHPENYAIVFNRVPSYMKGFEKLSTDISSPSVWNTRYVVSYGGTALHEGHTDLVLRLVARKRGQIDHQDVFIDPTFWTIDEMDWRYYNGGVISMRQYYRGEGNYRLIAAQEAQIAIPYVRAVVHADYSAYRTNIEVADSIFVAQR